MSIENYLNEAIALLMPFLAATCLFVAVICRPVRLISYWIEKFFQKTHNTFLLRKISCRSRSSSYQS
ncbi:hypothetical protein N0Y54_30995 [Nostoc punctiforme UO1]|uniref:hypothetical protein n=1 Tax=Nostoc punctiforme TaxID=272131 RepID=UPI0030B1FCFA